MNKATIRQKDNVKENKLDIRKIALMIEMTLESHGVIARVVEINKNEKDIDFNLEIALGTPIENLTKLNKDLAMAIASPTGDVEIIAPIPGRSLIEIKVPFGNQIKTRTEKYKIIRIETEKIVYKGILPQLNKFFIRLLKLLAKLVNRLINFLDK